MRNPQWRTYLTVAVVAALAVVAFNALVVAMWAQRLSNRGPHEGAYAPGMMMTWMWGGMGLFWTIPLVAFLILIVVVSLVVANLAASRAIPNAQPHAQRCERCGEPLAPEWKHCPYCGNSRTPSARIEQGASGIRPR